MANFDWIAPVYDGLARLVFGRRLQRAQLVWLHLIPQQATVLVVGGGTGWLLEQLLIQCKPKRVVYLDASARMVAKASRRVIQKRLLGTVDFRTGDVLELAEKECFDVVVLPFVLDLFAAPTLQQLIPRLKMGMQPGGIWLVTDFVNTTSVWQRLLLWGMIRFFRFTTGIEIEQLANWQALLSASGLVQQCNQAQVWGMVASDVWVD